MATEYVMTLIDDRDTGQVIFEGLPAGPAGGASLIVGPGVELLFDCADGTLSQVFADIRTPDGSVLAVVGRLLGPRARDGIWQARRKHGAPVMVKARPEVLAALSRLARLDAARLTSRVAGSLWWAVEAAQLAARAGLTARATAEARQAARAANLTTGDSLAAVPPAAIHALADLVHAAQPELAARLRDHARSVQAAVSQPQRARAWAIPDVPDGEDAAAAGLRWWLDPRTIPTGVFQHSWWPSSELSVRTEAGGILVEAGLAPGADRRLLEDCRVRLVDPATRCVIAAAPFRGLGGSRVTAELRPPPLQRESWVEVVDDESRPVLSGELRHIRRAMRWADTALSAGRRPPGPVDAAWARAEAAAWDRCGRDWASAGDADRACLAALRRARVSPGTCVPEPPSAWAKELAGRPVLPEKPFLAEMTRSG